MDEHRLMMFEFQGNPVRAVMLDGEPMLVAKDAAEILGYSNPQKAVRDHCKHPRPLGVNDSFTLDPQTTMIPEGDLYRLVVRSKMPEAERFEEWAMEVVLPTIRRTGTYAVAETPHRIPQTLPEALRLAADALEQNALLEAKLAEQKPLVTFAETCLSSKDSILVRELAKVAKDQHLNIGQNKLYKLLREWGLILKGGTEPSQKAMDAGYFEVVERPVETPYGERLTMTTKVTPKGQVYIIERLRAEQSKAVVAV